MNEQKTGQQSAAKRLLARKSDQLLDALANLKRLEQQKRTEPISTEQFHRLADQANAASEDVWRFAHEEERIGDRIETGDVTIEDVDKERTA